MNITSAESAGRSFSVKYDLVDENNVLHGKLKAHKELLAQGKDWYHTTEALFIVLKTIGDPAGRPRNP